MLIACGSAGARHTDAARFKLACKPAKGTSLKDDDDAAAIQHWADALGVDRSEILRDAVHRHLVVLNSEADAERWEQQPATDAERSLEGIADWGPAEDWSDWNHAAG